MVLAAPLTLISPPLARERPKMAFASRVRPGAEEPVDSDDLPPMHGETDVLEIRKLRQRLYFQDRRLLGRPFAPWKELGQRLADHLPHEVAFVPFGDPPGTQLLSVAHNGDAVGQGEYLGQLMRDVDDGDALRFCRPHDPKKVVDFPLRQRRGRLVENENAGFHRESLGDFDKLLLRKREAANPLARRDVSLDRLENGGRPFLGDPAIDQAWESGRRLPAEKHVLGDRELRHETQFLMDQRNAEFPGPPRRIDERRRVHR